MVDRGELTVSFWQLKNITFSNFIFLRDTSLGMSDGSVSGVEGFSGEVVEAEGEQGEHEDADPVVVEGVVVAEAGDGAVGGGFVELDADAEEADDAAGGDEAGGVEGAGGDLFGFDGDVAGSDGAEEGAAIGVGVSRIGGIEVWVLGEPCLAIGVPEGE